MADRKEHGLNQRIRVGVDARINANTNVRVVGSASGQAGVDSSHETEALKALTIKRFRRV